MINKTKIALSVAIALSAASAALAGRMIGTTEEGL